MKTINQVLALTMLVSPFVAWGQSPVPMASQPGLTYTEGFGDIANWTNGFAGGVGANRFGPVPTNTTGAIPDGIRITTSTETFVSGTTGGLQKGSGTIVLLVAGATDNTTSAALDFLMDFSGVNAGTLSFDWASINNSTGDRKSSLRVYWSTNGSAYFELTAAQVLNFTNNSLTSGSVTAVSLPPEFAGSSTARLRFYIHNGSGGTTGSRPKIGIDNLTVTATASGGSPTITLNSASFNGTFGEIAVGNSSLSSAFSVSGSDLTDAITITPPPGFEIRTGANAFSIDPVVLPKSGGTVTETSIDVRFAPTSTGAVNGNVVCASPGATPRNVAVSGTGILPVPFQVLFHETMGTVSSTTSIAAHVTSSGFDHDGLSFTGTADLRGTSSSSGYAGASGGANIFFSGGAQASFEIAGINISGLSALELSFGMRKEATGLDGSDFLVEVSSDGVNYSPLGFDGLPTGSGTTGWYFRTAAGSIPATPNLRIRFRSTATAAYRLDDVLLRNNTSVPTVTPDGSTLLCDGENVTLTSSAAASYLWSTGATTQSIVVSLADNYSVVVTDTKGNSATSDAVTVTVSPASVGGTAIATDATVPSGSGTTVTLTGHTGGIQWQSSADGIEFSDIANETSATLNTGSLTVMTHFRAVVTSGACPSANSTVATVAVSSPPASGTISGTVRVNGHGLAGVLVKLSEVVYQTSDVSGHFGFSDLAPGEYTVTIVEPLGYVVDENPKSRTLNSGESQTVDFTLSEVIIINDARGMGYWKHQFDVHVTNRGQAQESAATLQACINAIHEHYTPHFDIFSGVNSFADWQDVLSVRGNQPTVVRARQHLSALLMNLASLKIGQYTSVTADGRTAGDVLTFVSELLTDEDPANDNTAKDLAEMLNSQQTIPGGIVPTGGILYKGQGNRTVTWGFGRPAEYSLHQNYPNPFNPSTTVQFDLPEISRVSIIIYDILGREVVRVVDGTMEAGRYTEQWDGREQRGNSLASGVYFMRINAQSLESERKLTTLKKMLLLK